MTPAARSVCYFGFYLYATGLTLIAIPNIFLNVIQLPETKEVWIRIVGVLVFCIAFYYHRMSVQNNLSFIKLTVPVRSFVFVAFGMLVLLGYAPPVLAAFGAVDLAGAIWTFSALKK